MAKKQSQKVWRQMRWTFRRQFIAFLKTMTAADMEAIFAWAMADRQARLTQEAAP